MININGLFICFPFSRMGDKLTVDGPKIHGIYLLITPAFSSAISSKVLPSISVWS